MGGTVMDIQEVYRCDVESREGMHWFFAHARRFAEVARDENKVMTLIIGNLLACITTRQDLEVARGEAFHMLQSCKVLSCRVRFTTS